ncbi:MAG: hypothetical protein MJ246_02805 [Clostridia bacterium]|nr:hypothetical protein [Clostridia bacterium]
MNEDISKYQDIINMEHPTSKTHKRMDRVKRAAQFAPFAALVGYEDAVREVARLTDEKIDLDEGLKNVISNKISLLDEEIAEIKSGTKIANEYVEDDKYPRVNIIYFKKDAKKDGGMYITLESNLKKIDFYTRLLYLTSGDIISIEDLLDINEIH